MAAARQTFLFAAPLLSILVACDSNGSPSSPADGAPIDQMLLSGNASGPPLVASLAPSSAFEPIESSEGEACVRVTFEGVSDLEMVGVVDGLPNAVFGDDWVGLVSFLSGGLGPFANSPSGATGAVQLASDDAAIAIDPGASRLRFQYSAAAAGLPLLVRALDETGIEVGFALGLREGTQWFEDPAFTELECPADTHPDAGWCAWDQIELVSEAGPIRSLEITSPMPGAFIIDDLVLCTAAEGEEPEFEELLVDIKPGSDSNPINLRSKGKLPVAVLSTAHFDATSIDPASVLLGDGMGHDVAPARHKDGRPIMGQEDVNGDQLTDVVFHFPVPALVESEALLEGTSELVITALDGEGRQLSGADAVRVR